MVASNGDQGRITITTHELRPCYRRCDQSLREGWHSGHVICCPRRVGMTLEQCCSELEAAADRESQRLLGRVDTRSVDVRCLARGDTRDDPLPVILQAARDESAELVVIGARGRTGTAGVLLGALTERLIQRSPIPTLAVKKKGECLGVLRALLTLAGEG